MHEICILDEKPILSCFLSLMKMGHGDVAGGHDIAHASFKLLSLAGAGVGSLLVQLGVFHVVKAARCLGNRGHTTTLLGKLGTLGLGEQDGVDTRVHLPLKGEGFQVIHTLSCAVNWLAEGVVTHKTNRMQEIVTVTIHGDVHETIEHLESDNRLVVKGDRVSLQYVIFRSTESPRNLRPLKGFRDGELGSLHGQVGIRVLLSIHKELVNVHLESDVTNTHGRTLNLAPPFVNNGANVEIEGLVAIHVVTVHQNHVARPMKLKGLAVPTLEMRISAAATAT